MTYDLTRRLVLGGLSGGLAVAALPAAAISSAEAEVLVQRVVADINAVINSGKSERAMYADFERIFRRYGDVGVIARATLGPDARRASRAQMREFSEAFAGYLARKYGKRFREFVGGQVTVMGARQVKNYSEVFTTVNLRGQSPFEVRFRVSDRSGKDLFFDMVIEGISLGKTERTEIGALLDRNRGDIDAMIAALKTRG
ncbi:MAG: ABC transporter substrate-binding protein [Pseudomonadota bacterium]